MPVSPYTGQLYSGYTTGRPYCGSSTTTSFTPNPIASYNLSNSSSSSALRSKIVSTTPNFLVGNTAALKKNFLDAKLSGCSLDCDVSPKNNVLPVRRNRDGPSYAFNDSSKALSGNKSYHLSAGNKKYNDINIEKNLQPTKGVFSFDIRSQTKANINEQNLRPKEIDASTINVYGKPPKPSPTSQDFKTREPAGNSISRNRQVVRLTIKREKEKEKSPLAAQDNAVKTIAQKLIEKYTIQDKKKDNSLAFIPRSRFIIGNSIGNNSPSNTNEKLLKPSENNKHHSNLNNIEKDNLKNEDEKIPLKRKQDVRSSLIVDNGNDGDDVNDRDDGNEGDDELSDNESACKSDEENAAHCLRRATKAASTTKELERPQDIKDAIVAAMLHPGIDIESDEEIKMLMNEDDSTSSSKKAKRKSKGKRKSIETNKFEKRKKSDAEIGGEILVDRLRRFVKHQVSIKKENKNHISRKSSKDKNNPLSDDNNTHTNERIIPITLEDESYWNRSGESKHSLNKNENKYKHKSTIIKIKLEDEIKNKYDTSESTFEVKGSNKFTSNESLLLNEKEKSIKTQKKSFSKLFEPVYQTIVSEASDARPGAFQTSIQVSGEHSITQPENKLPTTSLFITDSVSEGRESQKEFLSFESNAPAIKRKSNEIKNKNSSETKNISNNDYKLALEKNMDKKGDEFQSKLDNSIKNKSSNPRRDEESRIFEKDELKSNYSLSNEETRKEFRGNKIESGKNYLKERSPITHFEDDAKKIREWTKESSISDLKDIEGNNTQSKFDQVEIEDSKVSVEGNTLEKGMSKNIDSNIPFEEDLYISNKNEVAKTLKNNNKNKNTSLKNNDKLEEEIPQQNIFTKVKRSNFLKPGEDKLLETDIKNGYELRKSATTQITSENDAESICARFNFDQDIEIKPSLRQFLEDAKCEMKESMDEQSTGDKLTASSLSKSLSMSNVENKTGNDKNYKLLSPKPKFPPLVEEKAVISVTTNKKKVWQKPIKTNEESLTSKINSNNNNNNSINNNNNNNNNIDKSNSNINSNITNVINNNKAEIKPKRVWKRPPPVQETKPQDEIFKVLNQLKRPGLTKLPKKEKVDSEATVKEKKSTLKEKEEFKQTNKLSNKSENRNEEKSGIKITSENEKMDTSYKTSTKEKINEANNKISSEKKENEPNKNISIKKKESDGIQKETNDICRKSTSNQNTTIHWSEVEKCFAPEEKERASITMRSGGEDVSEERDATVTLSTSQSADSAYGSSPSTPQPRTVVAPQREELEAQEIMKKSEIKDDKEKKNTNEIEEKCELCGTNCHKKCEKQMPNLCGVNQKLLAEALSSVKKGSSTEGKDVSRTSNPVSATKSSSSVSSTEGETTTTEDDETDTESSEFSGPAEIRAPIKTRPKYRKYNIEDFNFIKVLGKGSFGKVMLAQQVATENYFAVKCLKKDVVLEDNDVECCLIERKVLTLGTKHPYLCHLFCSFQTPSHLFFVMEYLTGGDLMFHIQRVGRFDEYRSCFYAAEIISGLKFLHNKGIIYRDLKLDNILLDYEGHIRIADFGMCKLQIYLDRFADTFCGTPDYMAPEVIKGLHYNQCVDWWSFGVLLYEMMIGKSPFKGCDEDHLFWLICNEEPFYPRYLSREAQSILKQLLDKDATRRLGPPYSPHGEIKCHAFFKYVDWNKIERKEVVTPYKPKLRHILDVQYFDRLFTKRNAAITPLDDSILETMDQTPFKDFSYTNPNITD